MFRTSRFVLLCILEIILIPHSKQDDVHLVLDNSTLYNKPDHNYHKLAVRMGTQIPPILEKLQPPSLSPGMLDDSLQRGNLEPPMETLRMLTTKGSIDEDSDMILSSDPLTSLFSQEFMRVKPPPAKLIKPSKPRARYRFKKPIPGEPTEGFHNFRAPPVRLTRSVHAAEQSLLTASMLSPNGTVGEERQSSGESSQRSGRTTPRTRSARALAAALESNSNEVPPEVAAAAEREAAEEAAVAARKDSDAALALKRQKAREYRENRKKRKREEAEIERAADAGMPAFVEEVNDMQSFAMFNKGWVLPEGSRRGNRPAPERPSVPLQYKGVHESGLATMTTQSEGPDRSEEIPTCNCIQHTLRESHP